MPFQDHQQAQQLSSCYERDQHARNRIKTDWERSVLFVEDRNSYVDQE